MRFFLLISLFAFGTAYAQERCGTVEYSKKLNTQQNEPKFEKWLQEKIINLRPGRIQRGKAGPYKVPVVVHIIHNGEPIGSGANITDAQVLSQISVLNEDFNRLNADAVNTPAQFASLAGNMNLEFVLAKQTPEGLPTTGIVRVNGNKSGWSLDENFTLKSKSYWPSEDYMNIWVCNLTSHLGYTQFPVSNLPGLENGSNNAQTDGIVVWHEAFGSSDDGSFRLDPDYNKGRTLTHEMGHFFGLRHIWGDDGSACNGDDYVDDTPNQAGSSAGCPNHPRTDNCSSAKMFQNFLDYTDDLCMNLFTKDQVTRMSTVIENSPRRASLLTSHGLLDPTPVPNDLGIREILSPGATSCSTTIIPQIEIRNYGSNNVTSARIRLSINNIVIQNKDVVISNLGYLQSANVTFNSAVIAAGTSTIIYEIIQTNGTSDGITFNNELTSTVFVPQVTTTPFSENFNVLPPKWVIQNPDGVTTWQITTAPKDSPQNKALYLNFYDYEDNIGELDVFVSPVFDLSSAPAASLQFDVAYAMFESSSSDRFKVVVLVDCQDLLEGTTVYDKAGSALATAPTTSQSFKPNGEGQWRREVVPLNQFIGKSQVQLAFVSINDWGNNLYLDNLSLTTNPTLDIAFNQLLAPATVTCEDNLSPQIVVQSLGSIPVTSFKVNYTINNSATQTFSVNNLNLEEGQKMEVTLPEISIVEGINSLVFEIVEPNGNQDGMPGNNGQEYNIAVNKAKDRIPLREDFERSYRDRWTAINPTNGSNWTSVSTNFGTSVSFKSFDNTILGDEAWLASPVLDFSDAQGASMVLDASHRMRAGRTEYLRILGSEDCGSTYTEIGTINFQDSTNTPTPWTPSIEADWERNIIISLNAFAGQEQVRIAFVVTNENGNNLYLDNIEFFTTGSPDLIEVQPPYSIYGYNEESLEQSELKITFNLTARQNVEYAVIDMLGKPFANGVLTDVLNQTYPLELNKSLVSGIYIVRLKMEGKYFTRKVLIAN